MINSYGDPEDTSWHSDAARALKKKLIEQGNYDELLRMVKSPQYWKFQHFFSGMSVRNFLRTAGYGEDEMHVANLDDHYVPIMLLACGVSLEPEDIWPNCDTYQMVKKIKEQLGA